MTVRATAAGHTTWIEPSASLADRFALTAVPLPVRERTVVALTSQRIEPAGVALDVDIWIAAGNGTAAQRAVMSRWVASLCYVAGTELLDAERPSTAAKIVLVGLRHAPDDPSLRVLLGLARWDTGHRADALAQLSMAVDLFARDGRVAPMLSILTATVLSAAGRHHAARHVLEPLVTTDPRVPLFWDLVDAIDDRFAAAAD